MDDQVTSNVSRDVQAETLYDGGMKALLTMVVLALTTPVRAQGLTASFTTTPAGGNYNPKNIVAVWIEDGGGTFIKTIGRWAATRKANLVAWTTAAGPNDADAVSGATRPDHAGALTATWDLKNQAGTVVPDGTYTIRMELTDRDTTVTTTNNQGTFTFVKSPSPQTQSALTNGGFQNVTIDYSATATCGNSVIDPGETCDPPGSCPTSCPTTDACAPASLVGSAATCTAACVTQTITDCVGGDGCCPMGCSASTDSDCGGGSGAGDTNVTGGCDVGQPGGLLCCLGVLVLTRRRRRVVQRAA